jgi:hypothetical protein
MAGAAVRRLKLVRVWEILGTGQIRVAVHARHAGLAVHRGKILLIPDHQTQRVLHPVEDVRIRVADETEVILLREPGSANDDDQQTEQCGVPWREKGLHVIPTSDARILQDRCRSNNWRHR